jgi:hypothetical protein
MKELIREIKRQLGIRPKRFWIFAGWQYGEGKGNIFQCGCFQIDEDMIPVDFNSLEVFKNIIAQGAKVPTENFAIIDWKIMSRIKRGQGTVTVKVVRKKR